MILIRSPDGSEMCLVDSMDGYDGWTVVAHDVEPPAHGCYWCDVARGWKHTPVTLADRVRKPDELAAIIAEMQAQIAALQSPK